MTNEEKYKTLKERELAYDEYCKNHRCLSCVCSKQTRIKCTFVWLSLEAEEETGEKKND